MSRTSRTRPKRSSHQGHFSEAQYKDIGQRVSTSVASALAAFSSGPTRIVLPSDVVVTSSTYIDITGLSFPVVAGARYEFEAHFYYTPNSASAGTTWSYTGPASPTRTVHILGRMSTGSSYTLDPGFGYDAIATNSASGTSSGTNLAILQGMIVPSVDGTVQMRTAVEGSFQFTLYGGITYVEYEAI